MMNAQKCVLVATMPQNILDKEVGVVVAVADMTKCLTVRSAITFTQVIKYVILEYKLCFNNGHGPCLNAVVSVVSSGKLRGTGNIFEIPKSLSTPPFHRPRNPAREGFETQTVKRAT